MLAGRLAHAQESSSYHAIPIVGRAGRSHLFLAA
eukprot:CAMPEP_0172569400 /NCGR_PEP_ID=MMETSP1067-20121228/123321_1 /TAXON_ID=265564 ORGANISM="Thalassiosira punctigera, Strain Tpunct2005C2" /NCGR_SAMPLE_ID=MMETSP1067 /ASSEMBLY_ACC=CAM_ASM_000444 /LENGTH=33 /DNA_ID= /DNA_START= /DNA_END= /DNA_ORIENTATION=